MMMALPATHTDSTMSPDRRYMADAAVGTPDYWVCQIRVFAPDHDIARNEQDDWMWFLNRATNHGLRDFKIDYIAEHAMFTEDVHPNENWYRGLCISCACPHNWGDDFLLEDFWAMLNEKNNRRGKPYPDFKIFVRWFKDPCGSLTKLRWGDLLADL